VIFRVLWMIVFGAMLQQGAPETPRERTVGVGHSVGEKPQAFADSAQRYRVAGVLVNSVSGQPVSRGDVSLWPLAGPGAGDVDKQTMRTAEDGRFAFEVDSAGHYVLWADRKGYSQQAYKQHGTFSTGIVVGVNAKVEQLRFELTPDASLSGQVLDEMGEPARNATVLLLRQGVMQGSKKTVRAGQTITDDRGQYRFGHVSSGTYFVAISTWPWYAFPPGAGRASRESNENAVSDSENVNTDVVYPITYFPSAIDFGAATPMVLHLADAATANVSLAPAPAIHIALGRNGDSQEQVSVQSATQIIADGIEQSLPLRTSLRDGVTEVEGLPPGRVNLMWSVVKGDERKTRQQTFRFGSSGNVESSEDDATAAVKGAIQTDARTRLGNPVILLRNRMTGVETRAFADKNGEFSFFQELAAGTYEVSLARTPGASLGILASGAKVSGTTIEIVAGQNVELKIAAAMGSGLVTGVAMRDGKAVDGVMVALVPADMEHAGNLLRVDQRDSYGSFNLAQVVPGRYTVVAMEDAWKAEWRSAEFLRRFLARGKRVEVVDEGKIRVNVEVQSNLSVQE